MSQNKVQQNQLDIALGLPSVNVPVGTPPSTFVSWYLNPVVSHAGVTVPPFSDSPQLGGVWNGPGPGSYITGPVFGDLGPVFLQTTRIATLGTITPGSGYTNGVYPGVFLTGGIGGNATADITVAGGIVTSVILVNPGYDYVIGDILSANNADIGGTGIGFTIPVATVLDPDFVVWGQNTLEMEMIVQAAGPSNYLGTSVFIRDAQYNGFLMELGTNPGPLQFDITIRKSVGGINTAVATSTSNFTHGGNVKTIKMTDDGTHLRLYVDSVLVDTFLTILPYSPPRLKRLYQLSTSFNNGEKFFGAHILGT